MVDRVARSFSLRKLADKDGDRDRDRDRVRAKIRHENTHLGMGAVQGPPSAFATAQRRPSQGLSAIGEIPSEAAYPSSRALPTRGTYGSSLDPIPAEPLIPPLPSSSPAPSSDAPVPSRPARSVRRPSQQPVFAVATPAPSRPERRPRSPFTDQSVDQPAIPVPHVNRGTHIPPADSRRRPSEQPSDQQAYDQQAYEYDQQAYEYDQARSRRPDPRTLRPERSDDQAPLGSLTRQGEAPEALRGAVAALQSAGRKHQVDRIRRVGGGAEEHGDQGGIEQVIHVKRRPLATYERAAEKSGRTPPELLAIDAVLRKARVEWAPLARDDVNPAALALDMIDSSAQGELSEEFQRMSALLDAALQGSVEDHYEAFAAAITRHHQVLSALGTAQKNVGQARRKLNDARDALSARRGDLVSLWQKSQAVQESLRLLDTAEWLRDTPAALERLVGSKLFYDAVTLLMAAERTAKSPEMQEIAAIGDVRAYLAQQQHSLLDLITEELHNHLYLKAPSDDALWVPYAPGQTDLPPSSLDKAATTAQHSAQGDDENVDAYADSDLPAAGELDDTEATPLAALDRFLNRLSAPGARNPGYATRSTPVTLADAPTIATLGPAGAGFLFFGLGCGSGLGGEADSDPFAYIEMLLESAAKMGKLLEVLDAVSQRQQAELHQLVEGTLDEVERRHDAEAQWGSNLNRRASSAPWANRSSLVARNGAGGARTLTFSGGPTGGPNSALLALTSLAPGALGGKSASEVYVQARDAETLRDLFWTLFAKFDGVLQCYRVVYEVCARLPARAGEKRSIKPRVLWKHMQDQLQGILTAHLTAGTNDAHLSPGVAAASARRTMVDINEVLRLGRVDRDSKKRLFSLGSDASVATVVGSVALTDRNTTRKYEEHITSAIRTYLPGLVSSEAGPVGGSGFASELAAIDLSAWLGAGGNGSPGSETGANAHRTLAKPDIAGLAKLFAPVLVFIARVKRVLPADAEGTDDEYSDDEETSLSRRQAIQDEEEDPGVATNDPYARFLGRFVRHTFLPHLEARVQAQFNNAIAGLEVVPQHEEETARPDPANGERPLALMSSLETEGSVSGGKDKPVSKAVPNTVHVLQDTYGILQHMPFQKRRVARLMAVLVVELYKRAASRYTALVTRDAEEGRGKFTCAVWAEKPELVSLLTEAVDLHTSEARRSALIVHEVALLASLSGDGGKVAPEQLLPESVRRRMVALATLKHSIDNFTQYLRRLKPVVTLPTPVEPEALDKASTVLELPLTEEMVRRFTGLPTTFDHLARTILFALRAELRLQLAWHIHVATIDRRGEAAVVNDVLGAPFVNEESSLEPDPNINLFNDKLASWDDALSQALVDEDRMFLYVGLARFMDELLVASVKHIRAMNRNGVSKMERNVLALEQNIKSLALSASSGYKVEVSLPRSRALFDLLLHPPEYVIDWLKRTGPEYKFDEYTSVLNLILGLDNTAGTSEPKPLPQAGTMEKGLDAARERHSELLIDLHQAFSEE